MQEMREELEDLSFRRFSPEAHAMITARLDGISARAAR